MHRIQLPFHYELNHAYVHLVPWEDGWILVDTGFGSDTSWRALCAALAERGIGWREIHTVVLTHGHPDHMGNAPRVVAESGARLWFHPREAEYLRRLSSPPRPNADLIRWGSPRDMVDRVAEAARDTGQYFRPLVPDVPIDDGMRVGPFTAVWTPGHASGHLCLWDPTERVLIAGDHVLPRITPHVAWVEGEDALGNFLASLERVSKLPAASVLPSHGDPFADLAGRCREIAAHHAERCSEIRGHFEGGARTPHELAQLMWRREGSSLSPFQYLFAMYEVAAHLAHMGLPCEG
ncbi:MAG: MBL fold metallo-hydrolase [Bryobacteraceae bacterium]